MDIINAKDQNYGTIQNQPLSLTIDGHTLEGTQITQKKVLQECAKRREYIYSKTQTKIISATEAEWQDWERAFKCIPTHSISTRSRAKLFRMYAGISYTNKAYYRFGHKDTDQCSFCQTDRQDFVHLFLECTGVKNFRETLQKDWQAQLNKKDWFFGTDNEDLSYLIRESNIYLHTMNWKGKSLSKVQLYVQICENEKIEAEIALRKNRLGEHIEKWAGRFSLMQIQF